MDGESVRLGRAKARRPIRGGGCASARRSRALAVGSFIGTEDRPFEDVDLTEELEVDLDAGIPVFEYEDLALGSILLRDSDPRKRTRELGVCNGLAGGIGGSRASALFQEPLIGFDCRRSGTDPAVADEEPTLVITFGGPHTGVRLLQVDGLAALTP